MGEIRIHKLNFNNYVDFLTGFWWGNLSEIDQWGDSDVDGRIILSWIFRKCGGGLWGLDGVGSG